jgi:hypothetical protein
MSTSIYPEDPFLSASRMPEFESLDATLDPFRVSLDELEEEIDLAERYGHCSGEVAEAARQDLEELTGRLEYLILGKMLIHQRIGAAGKVPE